MKDAHLKISVVMPSYNHGQFIHEAIESVLSQNYPHVELLVMDGGSTDNTLEILQSYGSQINFVSEKDNGQADAINRGLQRVRGDILCWLNSDDLLEPGALSTVAYLFENKPDVEFIYGKAWNIDKQGQLLGCAGVLPFNLWKLIHHRNFIHQPSFFFRRSLFEKAGLIREELHYVMDWELWIRFGMYKGTFVEQYLSKNRTYFENKTSSGGFQRWREICHIVNTFTDMNYAPVKRLYLAETFIQRLHSMLPRIGRYLCIPLERYFYKGIMSEFSGCYEDGGVAQNFYISIPNPEKKKYLKFTFTPLSAYARTRYGAQKIYLTMTNGKEMLPSIEIQENGRSQEFFLPIDQKKQHSTIIHLHCQANWTGYLVHSGKGLPERHIVSFLDSAEVVDRPGVTSA